jgi:hypothetical protein
MRRIALFVAFILGLTGAAYGSQAPRVWVDSNGNRHVESGTAGPAQQTDGSQAVTDPATGRSYASPPSESARTAQVPAQQQGEPAARPSSYVQWQDPSEGAFSVSLPRGWNLSGGTVRTTRIEPHYVVRAQSPDGGVLMFMDDPRIAIRQVPNMMTLRMGMREGQIIPSAWGGRILLQRYRPAPEAASEYVREALCPSATQFQGGIIPGQTQDLNERFGRIAQSEGKQIHVDAGELSFKCGDRVGYVYAITLQAWQPGGPVSVWVIYRIAGYLATSAESASAAAAMHTMLGTFQMNQQWLQNFARESNDMAGNVIRESNAVTQSTIERAEQQDAQMQAQDAAWRKNSDASFHAISGASRAVTGASSANNDDNGHGYNAQLDTKTVCDDVGHCQTVDASITNWYADCSGTFYPASESGSPPSSSTSACWNKGH